MKELSLNILDIAKNSVKANADTVKIEIDETDETLRIIISDNGCGMTKELLESVTDPFTTTRTTRKVGMGIPLFKMAAEMTDGTFSITSRCENEFPDSHGTKTSALFYKNHIDFTPLGDIVSSVTTLIQGSPDIRWVFNHKTQKGEVELDTAEIKAVIGEISLAEPEILVWIKENLEEQYDAISK